MTLPASARRAQLGLFAAFVVLAASVAALIIVPRHSRPVAIADVGTVAPDFQLYDTHGQVVTLSEHRGDAVVLFFSSINNPNSDLYSERVDRLCRDYAVDGRVKFFAINIPGSEKLDPLALRLDPRIADRSFPTLLDDRGDVATRYSARQTPFMVVINPRGIVRYRGPFDNNADLAFASRPLCAEALRGVLDDSTTTVARAH